MQPPTYIVRRLLRKASKGVSASSVCTLDAVMKFDCPESPHGVYNELVALKLGQMLNAPLATGVMTISGDGQTFASLRLGSRELVLPDVAECLLPQIAGRYPSEACALLAFDLWVGNDDRKGNFKAFVSSPHINLFAGFDHALTLLGMDDDPTDRLEKLGSAKLLVRFHPFYGLVDKDDLEAWIKRIQAIPDEHIRECCQFGKQFRAVSVRMQSDLAEALIVRKKLLQGILVENASRIYGGAGS